MISLLRSHNLGAYGYGGGYEPGMSSETGFELNQRRVLEYALLPHAGGWREAKIYRAGWGYNHPLIIHRAESHGGRLPACRGLLDVTPENVVLSAMTPAEGEKGRVQVRVYEAEGRATHNAQLRVRARMEQPREINLLGDTIRKITASSDTLRFDLHPYEIKTFEMKLGQMR
jgi:alpha-mannosidase